MTGFQNLFTGNVVKPAQTQFQPLSFGTNTALYWPTETLEGVPYVAALIDATATAGGLELMMPLATSGSTGVACLIQNVGSNSFTVTDQSGNAIVSIAASQVWLIVLTDNSTANGTWTSTQFGATTSNAQASSLAGAGLIASGSLLELNIPTQLLSVNTLLNSSFRANAAIWTAVNGTFQLDTIANLTAGWFCFFSNEGTGTLTLTTSSGQTINGASSLAIPAGVSGQYYSGIIVCAAGGFNVFGLTPTPTQINAGGTGATTSLAALANLGGTSIGITIFTAPNAAAVVAALGINLNAFTELTVDTTQSPSTGSSGTGYVCTAAISFEMPLTTGLTKSWFIAIYAQAGLVTLTPQPTESINGLAAGANYTLAQGTSALFMTDMAGNWWPFFIGGSSGAAGSWAIAGGTANAITAAYNPANPALIDGMLLGVRFASPNTATAPTFKPDALTAYPITKFGGEPLLIGDIAGQYAEGLLRFNLANTRWELLNPAFGATAISLPTNLASNISGTTDLGSISPNTLNVNVTGVNTITSFGTSANINEPLYFVRFTGSLLITYNGTSLLTPTKANIQTAAGDSCFALYLGSGNWQIVEYARADGKALSLTGPQVQIASATYTDLGSTNVNLVQITGTTTIVGLGSSSIATTATTANPLYFVTFTGSLTLTYNATSLILPTAANIQTTAGDSAVFQYLGSNNWQCISYSKVNGAPLVGTGLLQSGTISSAAEASIDFNAAVQACSTVQISFFGISLATDNVSVEAKLRIAAADVSNAYAYTNVTTYAGSGPTQSFADVGSAAAIILATAAASGANSGGTSMLLTMWPNAGGSVNGTSLFLGTHSTGSANYELLQVQSVWSGNGLSGTPTGISIFSSSGNIALSYQITGH